MRVVDVLKEFVPILRGERGILDPYSVDKCCWGCEYALVCGILPHISGSCLRVVSVDCRSVVNLYHVLITPAELRVDFPNPPRGECIIGRVSEVKELISGLKGIVDILLIFAINIIGCKAFVNDVRKKTVRDP